MTHVQIATQFFSILTLIALATIAVLAVSLFVKNRIAEKILSFFGKYAILFGLMVALVATLGSLYYSEIVGYSPCKLCWYQRILMYPQVLLLGMAYLKKDKHISSYIILMSIIGSGIAFYHYLLQRGVVQELLPCTAVGYSVSCAEKFSMTYGFITIPFMSLAAFTLMLFLMITLRRRKQK